MSGERNRSIISAHIHSDPLSHTHTAARGPDGKRKGKKKSFSIGEKRKHEVGAENGEMETFPPLNNTTRRKKKKNGKKKLKAQTPTAMCECVGILLSFFFFFFFADRKSPPHIMKHSSHV